jgi:hypothetical protein
MNFIIKNLLPTHTLPEILLNGSKLLVIKLMGIKIIDSINFIPEKKKKKILSFKLDGWHAEKKLHTSFMAVFFMDVLVVILNHF